MTTLQRTMALLTALTVVFSAGGPALAAPAAADVPRATQGRQGQVPPGRGFGQPDRREEVRDRVEDRLDRREDVRDRIEDRLDRREDARDRAEDRFDRREDIRDRAEDGTDRREEIRDRAEERREALAERQRLVQQRREEMRLRMREEARRLRAQGEKGTYLVFVNGHRVNFTPLVRGGRTLVPFRRLAELLGATVDWRPESRTVIMVLGNTTVQLTVGSNTALVNGQPAVLEVPADVVGGSTYVPLRFVAEALGALVDYDPETGAVIVIGGAVDDEVTEGEEATGEEEAVDDEEATEDEEPAEDEQTAGDEEAAGGEESAEKEQAAEGEEATGAGESTGPSGEEASQPSGPEALQP